MSDDGRIPYIITPTDLTPTTYQPITYSTESFIDVDLRYNSPQTKKLLAPLKKTVLWLAHNQSDDGSWGYIPKALERGLLGFSASGDAQRSPRALSLLQWYYQRMEPLPEVKAAIQNYVVRHRPTNVYCAFDSPLDWISHGLNLLDHSGSGS